MVIATNHENTQFKVGTPASTTIHVRSHIRGLLGAKGGGQRDYQVNAIGTGVDTLQNEPQLLRVLFNNAVDVRNAVPAQAKPRIIKALATRRSG